MSPRSRHLLHLLGLAALFYVFALSARHFGAQAAFLVFFPIAVVFECRFWWKLFVPDREARSSRE